MKCVWSTQEDPHVDYLALVKNGLQAAAVKWNMELRPNQLTCAFKCEGKKSKRFGNRPMRKLTKENYESELRQLWRFCILTGRHEDMLTMLPGIEGPLSL